MDLESRILTLENELRGLKSLVGQSNPQVLYNKVLDAQFEPFRSCAARAYKAAPDQAINHNAAIPVSGYTESWDTGSNFASDKYVAPVTGYYHVDARIEFYDATGKLIIAYGEIYLNGSPVFRLSEWWGTDKSYAGSSGSDVVSLTAGQYLELYGYIQTGDGGAAVMLAASTLTFMTVHLISI